MKLTNIISLFSCSILKMDFVPFLVHFRMVLALVHLLLITTGQKTNLPSPLFPAVDNKSTHVLIAIVRLNLNYFKKQKASGLRFSKLAHVPEDFWYVTKFTEHSSCCISLFKPSAKELGSLPAFVGAVNGLRNQVAPEALLK
jgi:hypothetical protein